MDPLSIATAVGGTVKTLYQVSNALYTFASQAKQIDSVLTALQSDINSLLAILEAIQNVYTNRSSQPAFEAARGTTTFWESIRACLHDCQDTALDLQKIFDIISGSGESHNFFALSVRQLRLNRKQVDINRIQARLQTHKMNLQMLLQMLNLLVASASPNLVIDSIGERIDDLTRMIAESNVQDNQSNAGMYSSDGDDGEISVHNYALRHSAMDIISQATSISSQSTFEGDTASELVEPSPDDSLPGVMEVSHGHSQIGLVSASDDDSDDELDVDSAIRSLKRGVELCDGKRFSEAVKSLQNAMKIAHGVKQTIPIIEKIREAKLKLGIAYLYQKKWEAADVVFSDFILETSTSQDSYTYEAYYYQAQCALARHDFATALESCRKAIKGQKRLLGKTHPSHYRSLSLLVLTYGTSGDKLTAAVYVDRIPPDYLAENKDLAIARFTSEGSYLSIDEEATAAKLLSKNLNEVTMGSGDKGIALRWAAGAGQKEIVQLLLWQKVDIDTVSVDGVTPLMLAALKGIQDIVILLLDKGADIDKRDNNGLSALSRAIGYGRESVVRVLLERGPTTGIFDRDGNDELMRAAMGGHDYIVHLLLKNGVNVNAVNPSTGKTCLMYAAVSGYDGAVEILLRAGADQDKHDNSGASALTLATRYGNASTANLLVGARASPRGPP